MQNKQSFKYFMQENAKKALKTQKRNLARNFKHMTIVLDSNYIKTIIDTKECRVPSFVPTKPSLNNFKRESAKNA